MRLEGVVVVLRVALVHEEPGRPLRLERADVGGFENGAQRPLGRHRVLVDELPTGGDHAAEVLRPGPLRVLLTTT